MYHVEYQSRQDFIGGVLDLPGTVSTPLGDGIASEPPTLHVSVWARRPSFLAALGALFGDSRILLCDAEILLHTGNVYLYYSSESGLWDIATPLHDSPCCALGPICRGYPGFACLQYQSMFHLRALLGKLLGPYLYSKSNSQHLLRRLGC